MVPPALLEGLISIFCVVTNYPHVVACRMQMTLEPAHGIFYKLAFVPSEDSDLSARPQSDQIFTGHHVGSQGIKTSSDGTVQTLIRLREYVGCSGFSMGAHAIFKEMPCPAQFFFFFFFFVFFFFFCFLFVVVVVVVSLYFSENIV